MLCPENVLRKFMFKCINLIFYNKICFISEQAGRPNCPIDPYFIMPDKCKSVDFQILKLQELPDGIPQGEIPRHMMLYCDRYLCDKVVPGNRVFILGVYSIKKVTRPSKVSFKQSATHSLKYCF